MTEESERVRYVPISRDLSDELGVDGSVRWIRKTGEDHDG